MRTVRCKGKREEVAGARVVEKSHEVMMISADGIVIGNPVKEKDHGISIQGRSTQGVRLMKLGRGDKVVALACFDQSLSKSEEAMEPEEPEETSK